jgi:hypothetical protein
MREELLLRSLLVAGALALVPLAGPLAADPGTEAIYAYSGRYTFRIDARNRYFRSIYQGQAWASVSGNQARVEVRSEGYRDEVAYVPLREGQTTYDVRVTMEDPPVYVDLIDQDGGYVASYSREDNFSVWADEYRFVTRINQDGFEKFTEQDVEVRVNGLYPFGEKIDVLGSAGSRSIEVTLKRRDIDRFSNRVRVRIPSDASIGDGRAGAASRRAFQARAFQDLHLEPSAE